ncbi:beta strand repeat-containing protein [Deinococcus koreensis]|uniref:DUF11 domain-containing protein n=1 Tax=Deinococcus koreensis TaxID=2054903 RepID=A0A2K3USL9_9DEIO|nr:SdrD B-like domain-containing protein [Deinococcus koreensis]PNY79534.1 hypothetical protein CVO96_19095 [Deinococcus koreensis]
MTGHSDLPRSVWHVLLACLLLVSLSWGSAADRVFSRRYPPFPGPGLNAAGNIAIIGNSSMTCPTAAAGCTAAQTAAPSAAAAATLNNNGYTMTYINQGGAPGNGTINASQSTLSIPGAYTVKWAGLYWGGDSANAARGSIKFSRPGSVPYRTLTATTLDIATTVNKYQGFLDVTSEIIAGGNGSYTVADIQSSLTTDKYAGWSLVVVYTEPTEKPRNLAVFDGLVSVSGAAVNITVSPFTTPPTGPVNARVGIVAYEGDRGTIGDVLKMNSTDGTTTTTLATMSDAAHLATNFFDSGISLSGSDTAITRTPSYANNFGYDIALLDVLNPGLNTGNAVIKNNANSATLNLTTSGDVYVPGVVTTAIEIYAPSVTNNLTKTVVDLNGGGLEPGDVLEYSISAGNTGQDGTNNLILTDPLPAGITFVPGSLSVASGANAGAKTDVTGDDQADYSAATRTLTFRLGVGANATTGGNLAPAATTSVKFRATVDLSTPRGTSISNKGSVTFTSQTLGDAFSGDSTVASVVVARPDLSLTKTHAGSFTVGQPGSFTFTVNNAGPGKAVGPTTITDVLPAGLSLPNGPVTLGGANAADWSCGSASNTVTCTSPAPLALGASSTFTLNGVVVGAAASPSVVNTASVSTTDETATANNGASDTVTVLAPDLTITKSHTGNFAQTQTGATYTLTARNTGTSVTTAAVTVTDTLPTGLTATAISGTGWTCTLGTLSCTRSDALAAGLSYPVITVTVNVAASAPTSVINTAAVSGGGEAVTTNNAASDPTTITVTPPDLTLSKTHTGSFVVDTPGSFAFTVNNIAAGTAIGTITITDTLPTGLTLPNGAVTLTGANAANWSCTSASNVVTCTSTVNILGGGSSTFNLTGIVVGAAALPSVTNSASVSNPGESVTGNNSTSDVVSVLGSDLTITKTHVGNFMQSQVGATYTLTATNSGTGPTSGIVTVVDTLPTRLNATAISGAGWTCTLGTLTCTRSDVLAAGASYPPITLTVDVANNAQASRINTATVSGGGQTNTANDTASDPTTITAAASDLTLSKSHSGSFTQGQTGATYTLTATNGGLLATSAAVTVTDTLPSGLSATAISGTGWTCTLGTLSCMRSDTLAAGASYPAITVTVDVAANAASSVTNTASVSGGGQTNTANDTASDPTTIAAGGTPDLTLTKTHTGSFAQTQTGATYTLTARNSGTAPTSGTVTVTDTLPSGLSATAISGTGWTCTLGTLSCTRSDALAAGASYPAITLTVDVAATAPTSLTNTATVSGGGELTTTNNGASDPTTVTVTPPDLTLSKSHTGSFTVGQPGSFTFTVNNVAAGTAVNTLTLTDTLPAGLTLPNGALSLTGANAANWSCTSASNVVTCTSSVSLPGGASSTFTLSGVVVGSAALPSVTNTATVSTTGEAVTTNNAASDVVTVLVSDLTVTKTHSGTFFQGQTGATYTITATNGGTAPTSGAVTVTDTLPAGLTATAISGTGWTCTLGTLSCTRSDALAAGASYPVLTVTVSVAATAPTSLTNTATVSGGAQGNTANDSVGDPTTVEPRFTISGTVYNDASANGQRDTGEAGLPGVTLTLRDGGGAVLRTTSSGAGGSYSFPLLTAGTYSVTETQPAGFVSTSPDTVNLTLTAGDVQNVNFGEYAGVKITGQVFRDDGWGGSAPQANDARQNGTEAGIGGFTVTASNGGGVVASAVTDGAGRYTLFLPSSAGSVTVLAAPTSVYTATGVNDGATVLHLATSISDPLASRGSLNVATAAGSTLGLHFGLVPQLALTPDSAQSVGSPGSVVYRQRLSPGTPGTLTLNVAPTNATFSYALWHDVDGNGVIDPTTDTLLGTGGTLSLTSTSPRKPDGTLADLQLLLSVSAPAGVASGLTDPARLTVTQVFANLSPLIRTASVTDTTTTGSGGLKLTKFVRNVTAGTGFSPTSAEGQTGDTLEYCIDYQNLGTSLLQTAVLTDPVPFFTAALDDYAVGAGIRHVPGILAVAGATSTPGSAVDNLTSAADADAGTLTPRLLTVRLGDLGGGGRGTVCYRVSVQ